jgi:protein arginine kinase activator
MNLGCQACKKQPATVHLTDITPTGEKRERHLCDKCAQEEGVLPSAPATVPVSEILSGLVLQKNIIQQLADLSCPHCKLTFVEFRNSGLLGCPHDYEAFEKALLPLIERAHEGASHHIGKSPRKRAEPRMVENDLIKLRKELNRAIDDEQYEVAAKLRDRISTLERK